MNRRGEMTTEQIVVLIILITSFAVILFFLFRLDLFGQTEGDICHNSVVARGNIDRISGTAADAIPLDCKRSYVCITADKSCEDMQKPELVKVKTKDDVYKALAEEMAECWWMFGEGKINYAGAETFSKMYCSICDQVKFDDSVKEIFGADYFNEREFQEYLQKYNVSEGMTYADYFGTIGLVLNVPGEFRNINLNSSYYVLLGMTSEIGALNWAGWGAVAGAGLAAITIATGGAGGVLIGAISIAASAGAVGTGAGAAAYFVAPVVKNKWGGDSIPPSLIEVGSAEYDSLKCERISTKS